MRSTRTAPGDQSPNTPPVWRARATRPRARLGGCSARRCRTFVAPTRLAAWTACAGLLALGGCVHVEKTAGQQHGAPVYELSVVYDGPREIAEERLHARASTLCPEGRYRLLQNDHHRVPVGDPVKTIRGKSGETRYYRAIDSRSNWFVYCEADLPEPCRAAEGEDERSRCVRELRASEIGERFCERCGATIEGLEAQRVHRRSCRPAACRAEQAGWRTARANGRGRLCICEQTAAGPQWREFAGSPEPCVWEDW